MVYGNSIHSLGDSVFGVAKRRAAEILTDWGARSGAPVVDVVMPNIFGEHGVPHYNSVIATFSHLIARGETPTLVDDKELPLIHVQRVADLLLDQALAPTSGSLPSEGRPMLVSEVLARLQAIATDYRTGVLPDLADPFTRDLFNTYRAATFPEQWPIHPPVKLPISEAGSSRRSRPRAGSRRSSTPPPTRGSPAVSTGIAARWSGSWCCEGRPRSGSASCSPTKW